MGFFGWSIQKGSFVFYGMEVKSLEVYQINKLVCYDLNIVIDNYGQEKLYEVYYVLIFYFNGGIKIEFNGIMQ